MLFASRNLCAVATVSILTAGAVVACVPPLPGGALDDSAGRADGAAGSGGAGNSTGAAAAPGTGVGGSSAPGTGAAGGTAAGGSAGSPLVLVNDAGYPTNLAVDSRYVYWGDTVRGAIMRVSVEGGAAEAVAPTTPSVRTWVALDSVGGVYWSAGGDVIKLGKDGGPPITLASDLDRSIPQLVVGPDAVFWITNDQFSPGGRVMKVGRDGGTPTLLASADGQMHGIAIDATNVYWSCLCGTVTKVGVSGGDPIVLAASANIDGPSKLVVDAASVYWVDSSWGSIARVSINGGPPEPPVPGAVRAWSVAVDGLGGVFWTDVLGAVYAAVDTQIPRVLAPGDSTPAIGAIVDAANVYWFSTITSSIFRAPK